MEAGKRFESSILSSTNLLSEFSLIFFLIMTEFHVYLVLATHLGVLPGHPFIFYLCQLSFLRKLPCCSSDYERYGCLYMCNSSSYEGNILITFQIKILMHCESSNISKGFCYFSAYGKFQYLPFSLRRPLSRISDFDPTTKQHIPHSHY